MLSNALEEREIVLSKIAEINKVLPNNYTYSHLRAALFAREQNAGIWGYERSYVPKEEKEIVRVVFTLGNVSFISDLPGAKALEIIEDSYQEGDQKKGYNLPTREIVFPQYLAAYEISK